MTESSQRILLFQTAFIGDVILTLPLAQALREQFPDAHIAFVAIPSAAPALEHHPAINEIVIYDKRKAQRGLSGIRLMISRLRASSFDLAFIPHRSIRSALIVWCARIPRRIGFSTSAGKFLFTDVVAPATSAHEIERNLDLLKPLFDRRFPTALPNLYPNGMDRDIVTSILAEPSLGASPSDLVAIAPGSVWATKRWPKEYFIGLGKLLRERDVSIVLVGGKDDVILCDDIQRQIGDARVLNVAGKLSLLQSAELIRRCRVAVSNDSAPMHLAAAVRTPVVALYGATIPQFGFAPLGPRDQIVETPGLPCRPCSIHGGNSCPVKTFACMHMISPAAVMARIELILAAK